MAALILVLAVCFAVVGCWAVLALRKSYELPEGYTIETTEHWHDFFARPYWYATVIGPDGERIASGGGSMTTTHGEAMRIGRDLLRIHMKKEARN